MKYLFAQQIVSLGNLHPSETAPQTGSGRNRQSCAPDILHTTAMLAGKRKEKAPPNAVSLAGLSLNSISWHPVRGRLQPDHAPYGISHVIE